MWALQKFIFMVNSSYMVNVWIFKQLYIFIKVKSSKIGRWYLNKECSSPRSENGYFFDFVLLLTMIPLGIGKQLWTGLPSMLISVTLKVECVCFKDQSIMLSFSNIFLSGNSCFLTYYAQDFVQSFNTLLKVKLYS